MSINATDLSSSRNNANHLCSIGNNNECVLSNMNKCIYTYSLPQASVSVECMEVQSCSMKLEYIFNEKNVQNVQMLNVQK